MHADRSIENRSIGKRGLMREYNTHYRRRTGRGRAAGSSVGEGREWRRVATGDVIRRLLVRKDTRPAEGEDK